jgi:hypothetical protein
MSATRSSAFTTTVRVINRVHGNTTNGWSYTPPAHRTGFAVFAKVVLVMPYLTNGGAAIDMNFAHLAGTESHRCVCTFTGCQLCGSASGSNQLSTFAGLQFNAVNNRTNRNIPNWQ